MTRGKISKRVVTERLNWIEDMIVKIRTLPLDDPNAFLSDWHHTAVAESCLRRALEAIFDVGRHILAKEWGLGLTEYKKIAVELGRNNVLTHEEADLLSKLAGYRNRMVHFYHEIGPQELFRICSQDLPDLECIVKAIWGWLSSHPDKLDETL